MEHFLQEQKEMASWQANLQEKDTKSKSEIPAVNFVSNHAYPAPLDLDEQNWKGSLKLNIMK